MATKLWAALIVLLVTFFTSSAQILYKLGAKTLTFNITGILTNYYIIGGVILYALGGVLMILSLRGGEVSILYPIVATSYIWVTLLSIKFLGETANIFKWIGIAAIIAGIITIGFGSKDSVPGDA